jgi:hypothetical protein
MQDPCAVIYFDIMWHILYRYIQKESSFQISAPKSAVASQYLSGTVSVLSLNYSVYIKGKLSEKGGRRFRVPLLLGDITE